VPDSGLAARATSAHSIIVTSGYNGTSSCSQGSLSLYPVFARLSRTPKRVAGAMLLPLILIHGSLDAFEFAPGTNDGASAKVL